MSTIYICDTSIAQASLILLAHCLTFTVKQTANALGHQYFSGDSFSIIYRSEE